jgi:hypothetical protein
MKKYLLIVLLLIALTACDPFEGRQVTGKYYIIDYSELTTGRYYLVYDYGSIYGPISPIGLKQYSYDKKYIYLKYFDDIDTSNSTYYYVKICNDCEQAKATYLYGPFNQLEFDEKLKNLGKSDIKFQNIE